MSKLLFRVFVAVLLGGMLLYGTVMLGLGYANNLSPLEQKMHPERQPGTVWISGERDFYLVNRDGMLQTWVLWQGKWQPAEFSAVGVRYHILLLGDMTLTGGRILMVQQDKLYWWCDPEDAFSAGRKRIVLQRYNYDSCKDTFPFSE